MSKLMIISLFTALFFTTTVMADQATRPWYNPPGGASSTLPDNAKIQIYTTAAGSQTVTGAVIRTTPSDTPFSSGPISGSNPYQRVAEFKNAAGVITSYITANGILVLGTPSPLTVTSVYPNNGATGIPTSAIPQVGSNIGFGANIGNLYVQGSSAVAYAADGTYNPTTNLWNIPATLAPNTTYTIKFLRQSIVQTTGETTSSCGPMSDVSGVCQSTFTTGP